MFGDESLRLLRTKWKSATALAQELFAIFSTSDQSPQATGPLTVQNDGSGNPPIAVRGWPSSSLSFVVHPTDGAPFSFVAAPIPSDTPLGTDNLSGAQPTGLYTTPDSGQQPQQTPQPEQKSGGGIPAKILSGSGASYRVQLFENSLTSSSGTVTATALGIASDASLPSGTWVVVTQINNLYAFVAPVWLDDLS